MKTEISIKTIFMSLLLTSLLGSCKEPTLITEKMQIPDTRPPLLEFKTGLDSALKEEQLVFEKYTQSSHGTLSGIKLYDNGDYYKIYLGRNQSLKTTSYPWAKSGTLSQNKVNQIQKISNYSLVDYINDGPHEQFGGLGRSHYWYFYFDEPKFAKTQKKPMWTKKNWLHPKFVRKINRILE